MKLALLLLLVGLTGSYAQVFQNICKPTEIVFLLDHSENARKASTLDGQTNFHLLKDAWVRYMQDLQRRADHLFRIWAWAYSSRAIPKELVTRSSSPSQSINALIGSLDSGGSWTYMGLNQLRNQRPSLPNNVVIIISAQGSMNSARRNLAQTAYNTLVANGWNTYVIGVKSSPYIDNQELTIVNGNRNPVIVDDGRPSNKKSYNRLYNALSAITNTILCPRTLITQPPTHPPVTFPPVTRPPVTRPPITRPPRTGICTDCRVEGGYGFDRHASYCDLFYQCLPKGGYVVKQCAQSLIWDGGVGTCVRTKDFVCPVGPCNPQLIGTTYPSGVCCNMFFRCNGTNLEYKQCPKGQIFDDNSRQCIRSSNPIGDCAAKNAYYCNDRMWNEPIDCGAFKSDPLGSPCRYLHGGTLMNTALGTMWDQNSCQLVASDACLDQEFSVRGLETVSQSCSAHVLSTFDPNRPDVESPRNPNLKLYVRLVGVIKARGSLFFRPNLVEGFAYYYFFNNNALRPNSAFRIVFQLGQSTNTEHDLFSNNYCPECHESYGATVRRVSASSYVITTRFVDDATNSIVETRTQVDGIPNGGWVSLNVIWGAKDMYGVVKILSNNKSVVRTIQIPRVAHTPQGSVRSNKCGIVLGAGPHSIFVGQIDEFAYYSTCKNIDDILDM